MVKIFQTLNQQQKQQQQQDLKLTQSKNFQSQTFNLIPNPNPNTNHWPFHILIAQNVSRFASPKYYSRRD